MDVRTWRLSHGNGISLIVPEGTEPEPDVAADDEEADDDEAAEDVKQCISVNGGCRYGRSGK